MSVDIWNAGDLFTVRIYKYLLNRQDIKWANTYELSVNANGEGSGVLSAQAVANALAGWEATFHLNDVRFDRAIFSTLVPDGEPYDPDTFASYSLSGLAGARSAPSPMSLQNCLLVRKDVRFGRAGRFLYRRALDEQDVQSPGGDPALVDAARTLIQGLLNAPADGQENGILDVLSSYGVDLVMAGVAGGVQRVRRVDGLSAAGVTVKAYNNRYFDRVVSVGGLAAV